MRAVSTRVAVLGFGGLLAACAPHATHRPMAKPHMLKVHATDQHGQLTQGRVSTKSGELLILEPDGSVTQLALDSPSGRDAFALTEADLTALGVNLSLDLSHLPAGPATGGAKPPTAQQRALDAFAARSLPMLPELAANLPENSYLGAKVAQFDKADSAENRLVAVQADLVAGVDAETGFAYATCALADWAEANGIGYARHVRSLSRRSGGKTRIDAVFTLSQDSRPMGLRVMEPKETLRACAQAGIPRA